MPTARSQPTRDRILDAARRLFGEEGYERTTIRAVAAAAEIHPSMVMRYYESKEGLFAAAAKFDLRLPDLDLAQVPREEVGRTLVRHFLHRWQNEAQELPALLRLAVTHDQARDRLSDLFSEQVAPTMAVVCEPDNVQSRIALAVSQLAGLAFTRFVIKLPAVVELPEDAIVECVGATVQRYLTEPLATRGRKKKSTTVQRN